jgi:hypothetical protein
MIKKSPVKTGLKVMKDAVSGETSRGGTSAERGWEEEVRAGDVKEIGFDHLVHNASFCIAALQKRWH